MKNATIVLLIVLTLPTQAQKTRNINELKIDNNFYIDKNTNTLFSGKVATYYPNSNIKSLTYVKKGHRTGKIKLFYDSGKKLCVLYEDENHVNYGKVKSWHETKQPSFEGYYIDGRLYKKGEDLPFTGSITSKYYYGNNYETIHFKNGYWQGKHTRWQRNGDVIFECIFENNKIVDCPVYNNKL